MDSVREGNQNESLLGNLSLLSDHIPFVIPLFRALHQLEFEQTHAVNVICTTSLEGIESHVVLVAKQILKAQKLIPRLIPDE